MLDLAQVDGIQGPARAAVLRHAQGRFIAAAFLSKSALPPLIPREAVPVFSPATPGNRQSQRREGCTLLLYRVGIPCPSHSVPMFRLA
jgi:hypothetical protein